MNEKEELMLEAFRQLSDSEKISALDFMMYLVNRQRCNVDENLSERSRALNGIIVTLNSLSEEEFSNMVSVFKGIEIGLKIERENVK